MDVVTMRTALDEQGARPTDKRATERAIGAGLLRWAGWVEAVQQGEGAVGTVRGETAPAHARRRAEFERLDIDVPGGVWPVVELPVLTRLSQANEHAKAMGLLLYHDGFGSSARVLLRVHSEACMRALWIGDPKVDPQSALLRAVAEWAEEANALAAAQRRKLHEETVLPLAKAVGLELERKKRGRWKPSQTHRPSTRDLIRHTSQLGPVWPHYSYSLQSAAVHSSFMNWGTSVLDNDNAALQMLSLDLLYATALHHRLEEIYEGWFDWQPRDQMNQARQAMVSGLTLALLNTKRLFPVDQAKQQMEPTASEFFHRMT